jgi:hypothetical protein
MYTEDGTLTIILNSQNVCYSKIKEKIKIQVNPRKWI